MNTILIGIAGGTGSGKTTLTRHLKEHFGKDVTVIGHDSYYKRQVGRTYEERAKVNYDHPNAFDTDLLIRHLQELKAGRSIQCPVYSFVEHNRTDQTVEIQPAKVIIVEGILIFQNPTLRDMFDIKIFVETDADERILRRALRDVEERGRTLQSVVSQYLTTVKPMHEQYVEPSRKYADIVVLEGRPQPGGPGHDHAADPAPHRWEVTARRQMGHKPPAGILRRAACAYYSGHQITGTPWSSSSAARSSRFKNVVAVFSSGWTPTVRPRKDASNTTVTVPAGARRAPSGVTCPGSRPEAAPGLRRPQISEDGCPVSGAGPSGLPSGRRLWPPDYRRFLSSRRKRFFKIRSSPGRQSAWSSSMLHTAGCAVSS